MWFSRRCRGEVKRYANKNATKVVYTAFHKLRNAFICIQNVISADQQHSSHISITFCTKINAKKGKPKDKKEQK